MMPFQAMRLRNGAVNLADHFEPILYSGNSIFPRTITSTIDATNGIVFESCLNNTVAWYVYFPSALGSSGYAREAFNSAGTFSGLSSTNFSLTSGGLGFLANADPGSAMNVTANNYAVYYLKGLASFLNRVQYVGNGANRTVAHTLGIAPGMVWIFKETGGRKVWHRGLTSSTRYVDFAADVQQTDATVWNSTAPDASVFSLGTHTDVNANAVNYVAYLFGHDTTANGRIQCQFYTGNGSATGPIINLGWQPRLIMTKRLAGSTNVFNFATQARNASFTGNENLSTLDGSGNDAITAETYALVTDGYQVVSTNARVNANGAVYLTMAIR